MKSLTNKILAVVAMSSAGGFAMADAGTPDVSAITGAGTSVAAIGAAVFAVFVGIKVFKWARSAL